MERKILTIEIDPEKAVRETPIPPPRGAPIWPRVTVWPGRPVKGWFLVRSILGFDTHFTPDGYMPCPKMFGGRCPWHRPREEGGRRMIWLAPTPVLLEGESNVKMLQITAAAARRCVGLKKRTDLYGRPFVYQRFGRGHTGPCSMEVRLTPALWANDGKEIEHELIWRVLQQLWGFQLEFNGRALRTPCDLPAVQAKPEAAAP